MKKRKNFRKILPLLLALALAIGLCACGQGGSGTSSGDTQGLSSCIFIGETELKLGAEFTEEARTALGEPESVEEAPSCHYDGTDNIYRYAGLTVFTYMQDEKSILYSVEVSDEAYPTPEGVKVGMTLDEAKALCGDGAEEINNGISYSLGGKMTLNFRATDGKIHTIEYYTE